VTAGTIFDKTRTPLTVWFEACWMFTTSKDGVSAQSLQRTLEIGSYHTAWEMLHRLRSVLVRPGRERLSGRVEVDETYSGGVEAGLTGGRAKGKKVLTAVAVEADPVRGFGRCRLAPIPDASTATLREFITANIAPGATIVTDGWNAYPGATEGYVHEPRNQSAAKARGEDPGALLPGVHRVASLAKRWILGTHQGSVGDSHLAAYLNEFAFRFNRRRSRSRGMLFYRLLELAVAHAPVRHDDLVADPHPTGRQSITRGAGHPPSIDRPHPDRPWRQTPR
jgi:transposase-like protein